MKVRFFSDAYKSKRASHRLRGDVTCQAMTDKPSIKILESWGYRVVDQHKKDWIMKCSI